MRRLLQRPAFVILLLWAAITAPDLHKAFHVDDTFYLKAGQWIEQHPARPMSGLVNWGDSSTPVHTANQPPGFFYLVALTGHLFGYSEVPMHAMRALFTLLALACFHAIARRTAPGQALWLTALFALCPALMVNQGLMTDVPLLAMELLFVHQLLAAEDGRPWPRLALAALALCAALFIKYTAAPLLLVFPLVLVLQRAWRQLPWALIPFLLVAAWCAWNLQEYGGMHLLDRKVPAPAFRDVMARGLAFVTCLGAMAPFTPALLRGRPFAKPVLRAWAAGLLLLAAFLVAVYLGFVPERAADLVLRLLFTLNGAVLLALCAHRLWRGLPAAGTPVRAIALWALGTGAFVVLFSPMMASRHVLLVVPPLLLLLAPAWACAGAREKGLAVACTGALGLVLTLADAHYAAFYRDMAPRIARELDAAGPGRTWSLGHWGWQWYSEQAGMAVYDADSSAVAPGDILVIPQDIDRQRPSPAIAMEPFAHWSEAPGLYNFFCVEDFAGLYSSGFSKLPWCLRRAHRKTITAYRVTAVRPARPGAGEGTLPWEAPPQEAPAGGGS